MDGLALIAANVKTNWWHLQLNKRNTINILAVKYDLIV
jgi:hypothetical protein